MINRRTALKTVSGAVVAAATLNTEKLIASIGHEEEVCKFVLDSIGELKGNWSFNANPQKNGIDKFELTAHCSNDDLCYKQALKLIGLDDKNIKLKILSSTNEDESYNILIKTTYIKDDGVDFSKVDHVLFTGYLLSDSMSAYLQAFPLTPPRN